MCVYFVKFLLNFVFNLRIKLYSIVLLNVKGNRVHFLFKYLAYLKKEREKLDVRIKKNTLNKNGKNKKFWNDK